MISFDDTLVGEGVTTAPFTTYYAPNGQKLGPGLKPFVEISPTLTINRNNKQEALLVDTGIWSGKTMMPAIDYLRENNMTVRVITGFIKEKARQRFAAKGVFVDTLLPFDDYNDWAEMRDLLVLFIKSGFFIGEVPQEDPTTLVPLTTSFGDYITYYTQPLSNLNLRYDLLNDIDYRLLSRQLLAVSRLLWQEMERVNPGLTLEILLKAFPQRFGLPLLSQEQLTEITFRPEEKPTDVIDKLYAII